MDEQEEKQKYYWLTTRHQSEYSTLEIKGEAAQKAKLEGSIWFEIKEKAEADELLKELKQFFYDHYYIKHKERARFMKDWRGGGISFGYRHWEQ